MKFRPILRMDFFALDSNGIILNLMKCLSPKDSLQWFFSKKGNKPGRSKLERNEKKHTPKNAKSLRSFLGFPNFIKRFISNYSTLKYTLTSLKKILQKGSRF